MKKNVASQKIGCQMITAADGSAFTGSVTVYVTGDAGTQAAGSVSSGACTHEGNGYHTYAPAQAETNYDLVAFTFIGTGAIPATVQVYTDYPQTGDSYARLGAPAGASTAADVAAVKALLPSALTGDGNMKVDVLKIEGADPTDTIRDAVVDDATRIDASALNTLSGHDPGETIMGATDLGTGSGLTALATAAALSTVAGYVDTEVAAIKAKTDNLPSDPADASDIAAAVSSLQSHGDSSWSTATGFSTLDAAGIRTAVGLASANLDTQLGALPTAAENRAEMDSNSTQLAAIVADTGEIGTAGAGLTALGDTRLDYLDAAVSTRLADADYTAPANASVAAIKAVTDLLPDAGALTSIATATNLATVDSNVDAIKAVTDALPDSGALTSLATASALSTVDGVTDAIKAVTDKLDDTLELDSTVYRFTTNALEQAPTGSGGGSAPTVEEIADEVQTRTIARVTLVDTVTTNTDMRGTDDALLAANYTVPPTADENADALLDRADAIETGVTPRGFMRVSGAILAGKVSGGQTGTETFRNMVADSKDRVVSSNDTSGNRTALTIDQT
jgi:hypothetical protein